MAFDGLVTRAIVSELNSCLINGKINKIFEPNKNEILLGIYSGGKNYALNISIDSTNYRINLTTNSKPNPQNVLGFCMVLRKHLTSGVIKKIYTHGFERIVFIDIECHNELNDLITKTLVFELMGKHSNIILLNSNFTVIDSLRHLNKFDNSNRDVFPGSKYVNVVSDKLDFASIKTFDAFYKSLGVIHNSSTITSLEPVGNTAFSVSNFISKIYNGFGKNNVLNLLNLLKVSDSSTSSSDLKLFYNYLKDLCSMVVDFKEGSHNFSILSTSSIPESASKKNDYFLCISDKYEYLDANFFIDDFYISKEISDVFKSRKDHVLKQVLGYVNKLNDKLKNINNKINECEKADQYKLYGELITANLYRISDFAQNSISLENYYDNNSIIEIPLDSSMSPSKNAKNFFKKYRKLLNTVAIVEKQKELIETELKYLDSIVYELSLASDIYEIDDIYLEFSDNLIYNGKDNTVSSGIMPFAHNINSVNNTKKTKQSNKIASKSSVKNLSGLLPAKYLIDGYTVLVGKNNKQNDYLTCKLAQNSDIWFHTKEIHGSHVILKIDTSSSNEKTVPNEILYKCASLAAYFSKGKMSQNVPVDYTFVKYVKKPSGAKPGMVIYTNNKTLYVNPQDMFKYLIK